MGDTGILNGKYEGVTENDGLRAGNQPAGNVFADLGSNQEPDGAVCGSVLGTYLHGIFDEPELRGALIHLLRERRHGDFEGARETDTLQRTERMESARQMQERQLDLLADVLRANLDWELIYRAIGV